MPDHWLMLTVSFFLSLLLLLFVLVKWMVAGRDGPTGQCVTRLAGVANNPELVFVTVQPLPMAENHVLGSVRKTVRVMTSPVQVKKKNLLFLILSRQSNDWNILKWQANDSVR